MRSRRPLIISILLLPLILILFRHVVPLTRILTVYLTWDPHPLAQPDFDPTFAEYPIAQWSAQWPPNDDLKWRRLVNGSYATHTMHDDDLVPPILHHILLGKNISEMPPTWQSSRQACLDLHPAEGNYTHYFWDDTNSFSFMSAHYPWFLQRWVSYRYPIQRADSLRYFLLHHFGGIFLDLDLECLRSLGPLRKFSVVNIGANPAGVSNGFMMASPQHPFLGQLLSALAMYDRSWFWIPYVAVIFSTGPMFLSAEHTRYTSFSHSSSSPVLSVLGDRFHRLSGRVITPLFRHQGSSSWHNGDAKLFRHFLKFPILFLTIICGVILALYIARRVSLQKDQQHHQIGDLEMPLTTYQSHSDDESERHEEDDGSTFGDCGDRVARSATPANWFSSVRGKIHL